MSTFGEKLSHYWEIIQGYLFPSLEEEWVSLTQKQMQLIAILEIIQIEKFVNNNLWMVGRPTKLRAAIARAFVAKSVYNLDTTRALIDRLSIDISLRRICGFEYKILPSESTFS